MIIQTKSRENAKVKEQFKQKAGSLKADAKNNPPNPMVIGKSNNEKSFLLGPINNDNKSFFSEPIINDNQSFLLSN